METDKNSFGSNYYIDCAYIPKLTIQQIDQIQSIIGADL